MTGRRLGALLMEAVLACCGKIAVALLAAGLLATAAPVTLVAGASAWLAWLRGWPPARLFREAAWLLPMVAAWLAGIAVVRPGWRP